MKCPKCGYNSFEYYDSCKKCANDLTSYKETYGIKAIVLPVEARTSMAEELIAKSALGDQDTPAAEAPVDMFSFDVPDGPTASPIDDPFNFDDDPVAATQNGEDFSFGDNATTQAKADEDAFADLLESTSQKELDSTAGATTASGAELTSFSWDDTPDPTTGKTVQGDDAFDTLFGDLDEPAKK